MNSVNNSGTIEIYAAVPTNNGLVEVHTKFSVELFFTARAGSGTGALIAEDILKCAELCGHVSNNRNSTEEVAMPPCGRKPRANEDGAPRA